jgi:nucleotide-binding universal stress UspA family protein
VFDLHPDKTAHSSAIIQAGIGNTPSSENSRRRSRLIEQGQELGAGFNQAMRERGVAGEVAVGEASSIDDVSTVVLKAAAAFYADLLVMGTHGRRGVQRLFLGSVAERCVRQPALPVLLIPSAAGQEPDAQADADA